MNSRPHNVFPLWPRSSLQGITFKAVSHVALLCLVAIFPSLSVAQSPGARIDLYFSDWHSATPHERLGSLEERDVFTRGDSNRPSKKGAVLHVMNAFTYDSLAAHASTETTKLQGEQQILFVESGAGNVVAGGETAALFRNVAVLIPADLDFTLTATGDKSLTFYVVKEPTPPGFRPNKKIVVRDENRLPIATSESYWSHIVKTLFVPADGLATLQSVLTVVIDPLTLGKPHPTTHPQIEEVWTALSGTSLAFVGNQLRRQTPGMSFYHIPDNDLPHSSINDNETSQAKFLYFAFYEPHPTRP
jgi:mannose-6-phosphate isomerase-like protein (cupin superfamily)